MSDETKQKRKAVQQAWRQLTIAASQSEDDAPNYVESADLLVKAFPEFLGGNA